MNLVILAFLCLLLQLASTSSPYALKSRSAVDILAYNDAELMLGKDREIFHIALDLKWLVRKTFNPSTWTNIFVSLKDGLVSLVSLNKKNGKLYKDIATSLLAGIYEYKQIENNSSASGGSSNNDDMIKIFFGNLKQAEEFSLKKGKFIVMYIEEGTRTPSLSSIEYRKAFGETALSTSLNNNFIFLASSSQYTPMKNLMKALKIDIQYPFFAILCPSGVRKDSDNTIDAIPLPSASTRVVEGLELLATLSLPVHDIKASKIIRFLNRASEVFEGLRKKLEKLSQEQLNKELLESERLKNMKFATPATSNTKDQDEIIAKRLSLLKGLGPEPSEVKNTVLVTIKSNDQKDAMYERRFKNTDTMDLVLAWAHACYYNSNNSNNNNNNANEFAVVYPKLIVLSRENKNKTLQQLKLRHKIVLVPGNSNIQ